MKVLHVGEYVKGGVATYIRMLLNIDRNNDVENFLILSYDKSDRFWNLNDKNIIFYRYKRNIIGSIKAMFIIRKAINDINPDVIYCHSTWAGVFCRLPMLFEKKDFKIIYNAHGWSFLRNTQTWKKRIYACIEKILCRVTDRVINVSKYEYSAALRYGIEGGKQTVVYSGVEDKKNTQSLIVNNDENKINILYVGRFDFQKGVDILLKNFYKCKRNDIYLTLIGDGVLDDFKKENNKKISNISFLGWIPNENIWKYYKKSDVIIMPSRWEAFGLVAVEAMSHGKPVIASNRGALPEIIVDGENGWLFDIDDNDALLKIIDSLNLEEIKKRGCVARKTYEEKFTIQKMLAKTLAEYRRLTGEI